MLKFVRIAAASVTLDPHVRPMMSMATYPPHLYGLTAEGEVYQYGTRDQAWRPLPMVVASATATPEESLDAAPPEPA